MLVDEMFGLHYDPFSPGSPIVVAAPIKAAFAQITRELGRGARAVVMTGPHGSGKTLLLTLIQDSYGDGGASVSRVDLAALFPDALDDATDLVLIDEADSADPQALHAALSEDRQTRRKIVLACRPEAAAHLCEKLGAVAVHLAPLSPAQAKDFLVERVTKAGRADLFTAQALDRLVEASGGSPQALRSLAGMAMFWAAYSQCSQIDVSHVEEAVRSQGCFVPEEAHSDDVPISSCEEQDITAQEAETASPSQPIREQSASTSSLADALVEFRPERRPRRAFPTGHGVAAAAVLLAAISISGAALFGMGDRRPPQVTPASVTRAETRAPLRTAEDRLRDLDRVAKAVLPGRVVIALVPLGSLQQVSIQPDENRTLPLPEPQLRSAAPVREAPRPLLAQDEREIGLNSAPALSGVVSVGALPPKYMTADAISRALLNTADQAGFRYDDEFVSFRACVFRRVSPGGAEQRAFWRAVEVCLR